MSARESGWVYERHTERPWDRDGACGCGAPGAPCPKCSGTNDGNAPRMPSGFTTQVDKKGWQH
ncbi:hypothetical protein [Bradyrhizobium sp. S69]|uniref:hypothetical protein n=1 Tax=Bradyrhizobium sp. S69 TaxID=1641856 RepID=UPI00131B865B|nr:hypothetical protein [Bradyrhizobium sp. S69]